MQIQEVNEMVKADPALKTQLEEDPVGVLQTMGAMPLQSDVWIYRAVVTFLGLISLTAIVGGIGLAIYGKTTPEGVISLGSVALGAIAGLLAPSPSRSR